MNDVSLDTPKSWLFFSQEIVVKYFLVMEIYPKNPKTRKIRKWALPAPQTGLITRNLGFWDLQGKIYNLYTWNFDYSYFAFTIFLKVSTQGVSFSVPRQKRFIWDGSSKKQKISYFKCYSILNPLYGYWVINRALVGPSNPHKKF